MQQVLRPMPQAWQRSPAAEAAVVGNQPHFLGPMLGHELQQQQRLVDVAPVLLLVLQTPRNDAHDLLVVVNVVGSLCNLCRQGAARGSHDFISHSLCAVLVRRSVS